MTPPFTTTAAAAATATLATVAVVSSNRRWCQRDFLKEKLRVRERYWHPLLGDGGCTCTRKNDDTPSWSSSLLPSSNRTSTTWILPDGRAWRTYLPLISRLVEEEENDEGKSSLSSSSFCFVLLESQVDVMDYNTVSTRHRTNNSDSDNDNANDDPPLLPPEVAAPQERSRLQKLIQQHSSKVVPFCDLSVRQRQRKDDDDDDDTDEWNLFDYQNMTVEERSYHALFRAARLLQEQSSSNPSSSSVLILTDDAGRRFGSSAEDEEDGTKSISIDQLLERLYAGTSSSFSSSLDRARQRARRCEEDYERRNDLASRSHGSGGGSGQQQQQNEHWTSEDLQEGLQRKTLLRGRLNVTKENPKEAFVEIQGASSSDASTPTLYFINNMAPRQDFNRALHQDMVAIEPLPASEWSRPVGRRRLVHVRDDVDDDNDDDDSPNMDGTPPVPSARVVGILDASRRQFVATLIDIDKSSSACLVVPMDVRIPKIRIRSSSSSWQRWVGYRLWVQVDGWEVGSHYPSGHCIERLGPVGELETEIACLLKENQVHLEPFSAAAMAMLPVEGHDWKIPNEELNSRRDLRHSHRIFSVDPVGCQDIDDTMHARVLPNGDIEIGVHIADVSFWLPHDSPLDKEAQVRGTTFYLVDRRFDMLPGLLSSDLCSLHGDTDRLAVSTIWTMSNDLEQVKDFWFGRTMIHNCQAMTYEQAHNILHDLPPDGLPSQKKPVPPLTAGYPVKAENVAPLKEDLALLTKLARKLRRDREEIGGAVDLSSGDQGNELKFSLDEKNNPVRVTPKKQQEIHHTIAELMILANTWVAQAIVGRFPHSALLRIHRSVDESRFQDLKEVLNAGKISFNGSSNIKLADSLKKAENKTNSAVTSLFQSLATRAMSEAQYVSTGQTKGASGLSHYGLGLEKYTHFTSPIRRYADVVVHRQLLLSLTPKQKKRVDPPPGFGVEALKSLPGSETVSILHGEGISGGGANESSKTVAHQVAESSPAESRSITPEIQTAEVYSNSSVSKICLTLNQQNRMAKLSSFECQGLFLSLYFKEHYEIAQAVVTNLRSNGFWAYIPRFDFRAPVYLSDRNGDLQIDPALLGLPPSSGWDPTAGFSSSGVARKFPSGKCVLFESADDEHLQVTVAETQNKFRVRVLDVVFVHIFCDEWNTKARVPQPRVHLIADKSNEKSLHKAKEASANTTAPTKSESRNPASTEHDLGERQEKSHLTMYDKILELETPPHLEVKLRSQDENERLPTSSKVSSCAFPGRVVFGGFTNPDTRSAQQHKAIEDASSAAMERRNQALANHARHGEYDTSRRIESTITARQQRLAAGKRNTRKAKAK